MSVSKADQIICSFELFYVLMHLHQIFCILDLSSKIRLGNSCLRNRYKKVIQHTVDIKRNIQWQFGSTFPIYVHTYSILCVSVNGWLREIVQVASGSAV